MNRLQRIWVTVCVSLLAAGCTTEYNLATRRQESLIYGTDKEVSIGDSVARQMDQTYKISGDLDVNARVQKILDQLETVTDRRDVVYVIRVIDEDTVNAVSLPGGYIYVFRGLIDKMQNEDQLAGVIAHEMGHITARHAIKRLQAAYGFTLLQAAAIASGDGDAAIGANVLTTTVFYAYSRQDEFEADRLAVKYLQKSGYDPNGMAGALEVLRKEQERAPRAQISYFRTHPYLAERVAMVNQTITGSIGFKDYLNLTGNEL